MKTQKIVIIGGGIIGLMNAWYLSRAEHQVTLIDEGDITDNTSFGNAGLLSAFEKDPLAHPGIIASTLKLMLQGRSPLTFSHKLDPMLYKWLFKFAASSTHQRLKKTLALFEKYGKLAMDEYDKLQKENIEFEMHKHGLVLVYTDSKNYEAKLRKAENNPYIETLTYREMTHMLPFAVSSRIKGALLLNRNAYINPKTLIESLKENLIDNGVKIVTNQRVLSLEKDSNKITAAITQSNRYEADTFLLATGVDTSLAENLGKKLMMLPAKGYSITFETSKYYKPRIASLFVDIFTAITPRKHDVRITSKLELGSNDKIAHEHIINDMISKLKCFTADFEIDDPKPWAGLRPLTPNDMPLIGRDDHYQNFIYATGLGWLGVTMAPAIAHILEELVTNNLRNEDSDDILLFSGFYQG